MGVADQIVASWFSSIELRNKALEKRQNQPDLQKIMTTAIIEVQKEKLLT